MNEAISALLAEFENAAKDAQEAEARLRKEVALEIARLERQRAFAFRRTRLIRLLASASADAPDEEKALVSQRVALSDELGWHGESEARTQIFTEMAPVGKAVWECACGEQGENRPPVAAELEKFELWFETRNGKPFYALFDEYVPEAPLVDF